MRGGWGGGGAGMGRDGQVGGHIAIMGSARFSPCYVVQTEKNDK